MTQAIKVGIFAAIGLALLAFFILRVEDLSLWEPEGRRVDARFATVAGLDSKSAVRVAGVRIGRVDAVRLDGREARVSLVLDPQLTLTEGTRARIASLGLLGESYVELLPGPPGSPPLPPGAVVPGEVPVTLDQALERLARVGDSLERITGTVAGELEAGGDLDVLMAELAVTARQVRAMVEENRSAVTATVAHFEQASGTLARELPRMAAQMQETLAVVQGMLQENRDSLRESLANARAITDRIQVSVDNLNEISGRLARGEGTIGKLLTSEEAHDSLVSTLDAIEEGVGTLSDTLGAVQRLKLELGAQSFYLTDLEENHSTFRLDLDPGRGNRVYRLALTDAPTGDERITTERITITRPDGTTEVQTIETLRRDDDPTLSALLGFRRADGATLWGGLIEDSFGVQVDYPLWERKLWLSLEAFDFDRADDLDPHLRALARWQFHRHFYLLGGYDDFLESDRDSFFLGGGASWGDDNLKALLGSVPRF
jgi:phospholipid/cholesterol/gamma-HCH transport system substrate-binding protein